MSTLQRLAQRALGLPGQVRPRLGGVFELPPAGADPTMEEAPRLRLPAAIPVMVEPERIGDEAAPAATTAAVTPLNRTIAVPPAAAPREGPGMVAAPLPAAARSPLPPREAGPQPVVPLVAEAPPIDGGPPPLPSPSGAAPPDPAQPAPAGPTRLLLPERSLPPSALPPPAIRREAARRGEPDIQISIGRIEVRGEPERRRPVPAPRPAAQLMSLEDYLSKGRRR